MKTEKKKKKYDLNTEINRKNLSRNLKVKDLNKYSYLVVSLKLRKKISV